MQGKQAASMSPELSLLPWMGGIRLQCYSSPGGQCIQLVLTDCTAHMGEASAGVGSHLRWKLSHKSWLQSMLNLLQEVSTQARLSWGWEKLRQPRHLLFDFLGRQTRPLKGLGVFQATCQLQGSEQNVTPYSSLSLTSYFTSIATAANNSS